MILVNMNCDTVEKNVVMVYVTYATYYIRKMNISFFYLYFMFAMKKRHFYTVNILNIGTCMSEQTV